MIWVESPFLKVQELLVKMPLGYCSRKWCWFNSYPVGAYVFCPTDGLQHLNFANAGLRKAQKTRTTEEMEPEAIPYV